MWCAGLRFFPVAWGTAGPVFCAGVELSLGCIRDAEF
jgi:hypothetical protein